MHERSAIVKIAPMSTSSTSRARRAAVSRVGCLMVAGLLVVTTACGPTTTMPRP
jgi:hypothetical protein